MVTVRLLGGMGNQLFQLAYGLGLESRGYEVSFDKSHLIEGTHREYSLGEFGTLAPRKFGHGIAPIVTERSLTFNPEYLNPPNPAIMVGYWQTEEYFKEISDIIRGAYNHYCMLKPLTGAAQRYWKEEIYPNANTVSLHIRRKDYLELQHFHGMPSMNYYERAIELVANHSNSKVFIFSDDTEWCKTNFPKSVKFDGVHGHSEVNFTVVEGTNKYEDLRLMASCKHAILANSSFSWWGAWLGDNQNCRKVVAPARWFADETANQQAAGICPDRWIRL